MRALPTTVALQCCKKRSCGRSRTRVRQQRCRRGRNQVIDAWLRSWGRWGVSLLPSTVQHVCTQLHLHIAVALACSRLLLQLLLTCTCVLPLAARATTAQTSSQHQQQPPPVQQHFEGVWNIRDLAEAHPSIIPGTFEFDIVSQPLPLTREWGPGASCLGSRRLPMWPGTKKGGESTQYLVLGMSAAMYG